jgi:hypothetical protein
MHLFAGDGRRSGWGENRNIGEEIRWRNEAVRGGCGERLECLPVTGNTAFEEGNWILREGKEGVGDAAATRSRKSSGDGRRGMGCG